MNVANYSLLTLRPDPERIDMLCVGVVVRDTDGKWHVSAPSSATKLNAFGTAPQSLSAMSSNLLHVLHDCIDLTSVRQRMQILRSALALHDFEGEFSYLDATDFARQVVAILDESVLPKTNKEEISRTVRIVRPRTRARLRRQFDNMGILATKGEDISSHKVVTNFPVSAKHGLTAEFALKNSVMHITETVDFDVAEDSMRTKTFEAQAKCLVLRAASDLFGDTTKRHIVVSGSGSSHASRTVDLLSTVGTLYATESDDDMNSYIKIIAQAADTVVQGSELRSLHKP
jgi:hypothetical protein